MRKYIAVILSIVIFCFMVGVGLPGGWEIILMDFPSLLLLLLVTFPILIMSGLGKDFINAFRLFFGNQKKGIFAERKKAIEAVDLVMGTLQKGGIFTVILQTVGYFAMTSSLDAGKWHADLAVLFIPLLYAYMFNLLLLPIKGRINKEIIEYMLDEDEIEIGD